MGYVFEVVELVRFFSGLKKSFTRGRKPDLVEVAEKIQAFASILDNSKQDKLLSKINKAKGKLKNLNIHVDKKSKSLVVSYNFNGLTSKLAKPYKI